ncbi:MAG: SDR family oxidoreductase [Nitrososphaerota archaeon]
MTKGGRFKNHVVLVVGASSGIGRATAEAFSREGAKTILSARSADKLESIAKTLRSEGFEAYPFPSDVSVRQQAEGLIDWVVQTFGTLDILVNSVGIYDVRRVTEADPSDIEEVMRVNFFGPVYCTLKALREMLKRGRGVIVNVSSVEGKKALKHPPGYVCSKFALTGFTDLLRQELYGTGIRVLGVYPGYVDTPLIKKLRLPDRKITKPIPSEQVAAAILDAVEKGKAEVIIPNPINVKIFLTLNTLSPSIGDWFVRKYNLSGEF